MYCKECGTQIKADTRFCVGCGRKINHVGLLSGASEFEIRQAERMDAISKLEAALGVTTHMEEFVAKQEYFNEEKVKAKNKYDEIYNEMTTAQLIAGIIGIGIFIWVLVLVIKNGTFLGFLIGEAFVVGAYCGFYFQVIKPIILMATDKTRTQNALNYYETEMARIKKEEETLMTLVQMYMESNEFKNARDLVPEEYFDSISISYILKLLNDKRADSFKEAVNLYEDYLYKEDMKQMQMQQLQLQNDTLHQTKQLTNDINAHMRNQEQYMQNMAKDMRSTAEAAKLNTLITGVSALSQSSKMKKIERNTR